MSAETYRRVDLGLRLLQRGMLYATDDRASIMPPVLTPRAIQTPYVRDLRALLSMERTSTEHYPWKLRCFMESRRHGGVHHERSERVPGRADQLWSIPPIHLPSPEAQCGASLVCLYATLLTKREALPALAGRMPPPQKTPCDIPFDSSALDL